MQTNLEWQPRAENCPPQAVVAQGQVAQALLLKLADYSEAELASLAFVMTRDMLVVLGASEKLPWLDGLRYCAPDPVASSIWLPCHSAPTLAPDLLQSALLRRVKRSPILLWNEPEQILPLDQSNLLAPSLLPWIRKALDNV